MLVLKYTNLAVRFGLELILLGSVAVWSWHDLAGAARPAGTAVAVLAVAAVWMLVVHRDTIPRPLRVAAEFGCFALGVGAVVRLGHPAGAAALGGVAVANASLLAVWNQ